MRIGLGYDSHRFCAGRKLYLGGIEIPSPRGLLGHSDADALLHAIADALLGAMAAGDLGAHFPDTDPACKDMSSSEIISKVFSLVRGGGWRVGNVDATVIMEAPRLSPYIDDISTAIAGQLQIRKNQVSVKAKTNEQMGFIGRGEGIAAFAVVLLLDGGGENEN